MPECQCGCGEQTAAGQFLPGHDQRLRSQLEQRVGGLLALRALVDQAAKRNFLVDQSIVNSIGGAFQRANVYAEGLTETHPDRDTLRDALQGKLRSLGTQYVASVSDTGHCHNIARLADELSQEFAESGILRNNRFRIGIAQKALNLYLKYLWCLGDIPPPPHCPLDRRIIDKLGLPPGHPGEYDWTKLDDLDKYKFLIEKCREKASPASIPEWELRAWSF